MENTSHAARVRSLFNREAAGWGTRYGSGGSMGRRIERFAAVLSARAPAGVPILDIGCGTGHIARALARKGWRLTGGDLSPEMLAQARTFTHEEKITWVQLDPGWRRLPFPRDRFHAVIASSVLEYLDDPAAFFREIARVLRPRGWILATVPDMRHAARQAERGGRALLNAPGVRGLARFLPFRNYREYLRLSKNRWTLDRWRALLHEAGMEAEPAVSCEGPLAMLEARKAPSVRVQATLRRTDALLRNS